MYRNNRFFWDIGLRREMVKVVEIGRIQPCKAIDLLSLAEADFQTLWAAFVTGRELT